MSTTAHYYNHSTLLLCWHIFAIAYKHMGSYNNSSDIGLCLKLGTRKHRLSPPIHLHRQAWYDYTDYMSKQLVSAAPSDLGGILVTGAIRLGGKGPDMSGLCG